MEKEYRYIQNQIKRNTDTTTSRKVEGYACVFNSQSENIGFYEIIHDGAITEDTILKSDVFAELNHNDEYILARSKNGVGSLKLSVDSKGLYYEFDAPLTSKGDELLSYLDRGEITQSSFAFIVSDEDGAEKITQDENGIWHRDIYKIEALFDCSPVFQPAYKQTICTKRFLKLEKLKEQFETEYNQLQAQIDNL